MKKLAAILAFLPALAFAETAMVASHVTAMERMALAINYQMTIEPLAFSAATTTWVNNRRTAVITADSGTETMVTATTVGLDLTDVTGVVVMLKTSAAATAGGILQAYLLNPETGVWNRAADLDLTATATTAQTWPALWVAVRRGRLYYNPSGVGSVTTTIYLTGQPK